MIQFDFIFAFIFASDGESECCIDKGLMERKILISQKLDTFSILFYYLQYFANVCISIPSQSI